MGIIEEMMLKNGVIKLGEYRVSGGAVTNTMAIYDKHGRQTHRVEPAVIGGGTEAVVYDLAQRRVTMRVKITATAA